jgi:hypothetical protein
MTKKKKKKDYFTLYLPNIVICKTFDNAFNQNCQKKKKKKISLVMVSLKEFKHNYIVYSCTF